MKCLLAYKWVKLRRAQIPPGKGVMGAWLKLAARAAFRKGQAMYCGYINDVEPGMWSGGIVGLKSILGVKSREKALFFMDALSDLGYIAYTLNPSTKKLTYRILDWVIECAGEECMNGAVYTTEGYGFLCIPRTITERLAERRYIFEETDAWLDLYVHTVWQEKRNAFSRLSPVIQFEAGFPALTLDALGKRWQWEKTKVWRFLKKYHETFSLVKLPGAYGCLIINSQYPTALGSTIPTPEYSKIVLILEKIRTMAKNTHFEGSDNERICQMITLFSDRIGIINLNEEIGSSSYPATNCRVAVSRPYYTRAYFSYQVMQCQSCYQCSLDCIRDNYRTTYQTTAAGPPPGFGVRGGSTNVGNYKKTVRERGKSSVSTIGGVHEISRQKGSHRRFIYSVSGTPQNQTGTPAHYVPQHHVAAQALLQHQVGAGVLP